MSYLFIHYNKLTVIREKVREYIFELYKYREYDSSKKHAIVRERNRKVKEWCNGFTTQKYDTKSKKKGDNAPAKIIQWCWYDRDDYQLKGEFINGWIAWMSLRYPDIKIIYTDQDLIGICNDSEFYRKGLRDYIDIYLQTRMEVSRKTKSAIATLSLESGNTEFSNNWAVMTDINNLLVKYKDKKYI